VRVGHVRYSSHGYLGAKLFDGLDDLGLAPRTSRDGYAASGPRFWAFRIEAYMTDTENLDAPGRAASARPQARAATPVTRKSLFARAHGTSEPARWTFGVILVGIVFWPGLASYSLFRPYADSLKYKVILNLVAFPGLLAMFLPMLRGERPIMIPIYFSASAVPFLLSTALLHFVERE
jgi:hypothetical protein